AFDHTTPLSELLFPGMTVMTNCCSLFALAVLGVLAAAGEPRSDSRPAYRVLGNDRGKVVILSATGAVEWEYESHFDGHDLWLQPNGNILLSTGPARIAEVTPEKKIVW